MTLDKYKNAKRVDKNAEKTTVKEKIIYEDKVIERPVYKDKVIEKPVYKEKIVYKNKYVARDYDLSTALKWSTGGLVTLVVAAGIFWLYNQEWKNIIDKPVITKEKPVIKKIYKTKWKTKYKTKWKAKEKIVYKTDNKALGLLRQENEILRTQIKQLRDNSELNKMVVKKFFADKTYRTKILDFRRQ